MTWQTIINWASGLLTTIGGLAVLSSGLSAAVKSKSPELAEWLAWFGSMPLRHRPKVTPKIDPPTAGTLIALIAFGSLQICPGCSRQPVEPTAEPGAMALEMAAANVAGGPNCCTVVSDRLSKGIKTMTVNQSLTCCIAFAISACGSPPPPNPPPTPTGTGGMVATGGASWTGGQGTGGTSIQFPGCNPATRSLPSPAQIDEWRKSLKPRHKRTVMLRRVDDEPVLAATGPVMWRWFSPWCGNQKKVGACVAFTAMGWVATQPRSLAFVSQDAFNTVALDAYKWITESDSFPGSWPAQDTGSDGGTGCAYLVNAGYAKSCSVPFTEAQVKSALQTRPVMVGMNWLEDMFTPDSCGRLSISGVVAGGHEVLLVGLDGDEGVFQNSWGDWGSCLERHCGYFRIKLVDLFGSKLDADFDAPSL